MPLGPDYEKLFYAGRLIVKEHKKLIDGFLAMYEVHAPEKAEKLRLQYYPKPEKVEKKPEPVKIEVVEEKVEAPKKKKSLLSSK